jgi:hypothetical protein
LPPQVYDTSLTQARNAADVGSPPSPIPAPPTGSWPQPPLAPPLAPRRFSPRERMILLIVAVVLVVVVCAIFAASYLAS